MTQEITISSAQEQVDQWIKTVGVRYFNELTNLGILMEEVGELSRLMVRTYGEQSFKSSDITKALDEDKTLTDEQREAFLAQKAIPDTTGKKMLADEMADVLWVLICLANQTGVDLTEALAKNFQKKNIRDFDRHHQNSKLK